MSDPIADLHITRRRLVQAGGAATMAVALGGVGRLASEAAAATPGHLRRSAYAPLAGRTFATTAVDGRGLTLRLDEVGDLVRAATEPALAGRDDVFGLLFSGPSEPALTQGVYGLGNPELGTAPLFLVPVGAPDADGRRRYEVVVDRSYAMADVVGSAPEPMAASNAAPAATAAPPPPPPPLPGATPPAGQPVDGEEEAPSRKRRRPRKILAATVARRGDAVAADVRVARGQGIVAVSVSLVRGESVRARGSRRLKGRHGVRIRLRATRSVPRGEYVLRVTTRDRNGKRATTRRRVTLR